MSEADPTNFARDRKLKAENGERFNTSLPSNGQENALAA